MCRRRGQQTCATGTQSSRRFGSCACRRGCRTGSSCLRRVSHTRRRGCCRPCCCVSLQALPAAPPHGCPAPRRCCRHCPPPPAAQPSASLLDSRSLPVRCCCAAGQLPPALPIYKGCQVYINHLYKVIYLRHAKTASSSLFCHFGGCSSKGGGEGGGEGGGGEEDASKKALSFELLQVSGRAGGLWWVLGWVPGRVLGAPAVHPIAAWQRSRLQPSTSLPVATPLPLPLNPRPPTLAPRATPPHTPPHPAAPPHPAGQV